MNYTFQSFNFRGREKAKPYYDLISNISAEEYGHIELVSATINGMLTGASDESRVDGQVGVTLPGAKERRLSHHFIVAGLGSLVANSQAQPWQGDYVFNSGDLVLDLLHNFFLESGARMGKIRVYEATQNPVAREMVGYLIVRGGVHQEAYAKALSDLSGVDVTKLLPVPEIDSDKFPDARKYMDKGFHRILYRFSPDDYKELGQIWNGLSAIDGSEREVEDGIPEGGEVPDLSPAPPLYAPNVDAEAIEEIAKRL
jgi:Mn-containing catalase